MLTLLLGLTLSLQTQAPVAAACYLNTQGPGLHYQHMVITTVAKVYVCQSPTYMGLAPVSTVWFKAHCRTVATSDPDGVVAICNAYATRADSPTKEREMARPHHFRDHLKVVAGSLVVVGFLTLCALSGGGGCGFLGG